jgi:lipopolysaccharide heptosyltransferase II
VAQTRTITRTKLAALEILDWAARPLHVAWRPPPARPGPPRSFLVVEPWGLGDVILATPLLGALRENFPGATITLLAKRHAEPLLLHSGLVDEVVPFDFPWTAFEGKYRPSRYDTPAFENLFRQLRKRDFDVSLDARRDIRSNVVTYLAGARRRIGYDFGGGAHLLTDVVPSGDQNAHKIEDWLELLKPLGVRVRGERKPRLAVTEGERASARDRLKLLGISSVGPLMGLHPGASHAVRRWDQSRFSEVLENVLANDGAQAVIFEEREGDSAGISTSRAVPRVRTGVRELMAMIAECDLVLCNDSGPMHIAEALDVPVIALFGGSRSDWYGPRGEFHSVVQVDDMPCRPCFDACIFSSARCMEGISTERVLSGTRSQLDRIGANRVARSSLRREI